MFFFIFFYVFCTFFNFVFLLSLKQKRTNNNKYNAFLMVIDSISWTQRVFCTFVAVLLTSCQKSCRILDVFHPPKF